MIGCVETNTSKSEQVSGFLSSYRYSFFRFTGICYADALSTDKNTFLFGYEGSGGKGYIFPPSGALHFEFDDETSAYLGPGVVRGIRVRRWYACQYVDQMDATVNVYWSFSGECPDDRVPSHGVLNTIQACTLVVWNPSIT